MRSRSATPSTTVRAGGNVVGEWENSMTFAAEEAGQILSQDARGRVLVSREGRESLLEEYDRCGMSGVTRNDRSDLVAFQNNLSDLGLPGRFWPGQRYEGSVLRSQTERWLFINGVNDFGIVVAFGEIRTQITRRSSVPSSTKMKVQKRR